MISLYSRGTGIMLKVYVALALIAAATLSPLALSFIPVLLLVWYLALRRWPFTSAVNLLTEYFIFFAITLLLASTTGPFLALLIALPTILLIHHSLEEVSQSLTYQDTRYARRPTRLCLGLLSIVIVVLLVALLLGSLSLLLAGAAIVSYFGVLGTIILRRLPLKPVVELQLDQRMLAGAREDLAIEMTPQTRLGGTLFLASPYEWLKVSPNVLSLKENKLRAKVSLSPTLSGPSVTKLKGYAIDRWGLMQTTFELEPIRLYVIPRARYAAWLARKYLAGTKPGTLPLLSNIEARKPAYGLRRGVEYYGSQLYQPGDSLKNIDWKHSLKYNQLITKEFAEFHGRSAVILINLAVSNAEEADKLAYKIIVTAISLARENVPAALAVYNHEGVRLTTTTLSPQQLLHQSLQVAQEMVTYINPVKYLSPPDVTRLRANINRIQLAESQASRVLSQLLKLEYQNLNDNAKLNPATKALSEVFTKADKQSNIVVISNYNHDAEALAFNTFNFTRKGNTTITV